MAPPTRWQGAGSSSRPDGHCRRNKNWLFMKKAGGNGAGSAAVPTRLRWSLASCALPSALHLPEGGHAGSGLGWVPHAEVVQAAGQPDPALPGPTRHLAGVVADERHAARQVSGADTSTKQATPGAPDAPGGDSLRKGSERCFGDAEPRRAEKCFVVSRGKPLRAAPELWSSGKSERHSLGSLPRPPHSSNFIQLCKGCPT